jgi:hypothetical protein
MQKDSALQPISHVRFRPIDKSAYVFQTAVVQLVESRMPLQSLTLPNKVGKPVVVPRLPLA